MYEPNKEKTTFMIERVNYQYVVMPLGLENVWATYHSMMNEVFKQEIWELLEVYMNDMIVKSNEEDLHDKHIASIFRSVWQYNMRLNPKYIYLWGWRRQIYELLPDTKRHICQFRKMQGINQDGSGNDEERSNEVEWDIEKINQVHFQIGSTRFVVI